MLNQKLQLKLSQKLSPQQIQLMKLIQLSTQEFEQRLSREIEENPALDTSRDEIEENPDFENDSTTSEESDYDEIDVNDYLSDDDTPDYKLKTNTKNIRQNLSIRSCWSWCQKPSAVSRIAVNSKTKKSNC